MAKKRAKEPFPIRVWMQNLFEEFETGYPKADAVAFLVAEIENITEAEAEEWIDNLAVEFVAMGLINNATYAVLRNYIVGIGPTKTETNVNNTFRQIAKSEAADKVNLAMVAQQQRNRTAVLTVETAYIQDIHDTTSDDVLKDALRISLDTMDEALLQATARSSR